CFKNLPGASTVESTPGKVNFRGVAVSPHPILSQRERAIGSIFNARAQSVERSAPVGFHLLGSLRTGQFRVLRYYLRLTISLWNKRNNDAALLIAPGNAQRLVRD